MRLRQLIAAAGGLVLLARSSAALAWDFPEHAELMRLSLDHTLPPAARAVLARAVFEVHEDLKLCPELSTPLGEVKPERGCVPYSAVPALAGDHAVDLQALRMALTDGPEPLAQVVTDAVAPMFAEFLKVAPPEVARLYRSDVTSDAVHANPTDDDLQRAFMRRVDIRLTALDDDYTSRAEGCRAHFQDAARSMDVLLRAAKGPGDLDNALAQMMAHHARSLQLATKAPVGVSDPVLSKANEPRHRSIADALLEHALAVHFMQDAFAAGHIGTEPAVVDTYERLRRHDFLSRVGLSVNRTFVTQACQSPLTPFASSDSCWIAYGDGYLDWNNARIVASATARLQAELAMALDPSLSTQALAQCPASTAPGQRSWFVQNGLELNDPESDGNPKVQIEGPNIVHVYTRELTAGDKLSLQLESDDFDTYLQVRLPGRDSWRNDDGHALTTSSRIDLVAPTTGSYEVRVSAARPDGHGRYTLSAFEGTTEIAQKDCSTLLGLFDLLDPAPIWSLSETGRAHRKGWSNAQKREVAAGVVQGAQSALELLARTSLLEPASANGTAGSQPGRLSDDVLGAPLEPCAASKPWTGRTHPLCRDRDTDFRLGDIDASLWRPVLVLWPAPSGDVRIIEGEDSFGFGVASQVIYGGGGAVGVSRTPVAWGVGPFFGGGFSFRVDNLFPTRVNREFFGVDFGLAPTFLSGVETRYATIGFLEVRAPVWATLGAWLFGREASFGPLELGPTGFRVYAEPPQRLPHGSGRWLGWDIEALNIRLNAVRARRTASIGARMDNELRIRVGRFDLDAFDDDSSGSVWTVGAEITGGYSVFLFR